MDFHGFKWLISFCACSFQISIIMFIFLYRLTGGDDHADQRGKACLKCFCDTFDSDRCMNSLKDNLPRNTCQIYVKPHSKSTQMTLEYHIFDEKALE